MVRIVKGVCLVLALMWAIVAGVLLGRLSWDIWRFWKEPAEEHREIWKDLGMTAVVLIFAVVLGFYVGEFALS